MKQILKVFSFALVALWVVTSNVAIGASVSDAASYPVKNISHSSDMSEEGCTMHAESMSHLSSPINASVCGDHTSKPACKMLGVDHCSNVFSKLTVSECTLMVLSAMKIQMQDNQSALIGVSLEAVTPPPRF